MPQVQKLISLIIHGQYVDVAQQAFSLDSGTTLHLAIPALETLYKAWSSRAARVKYERFAPALKAAAQKLDGYYEKTTESKSYIMTMCSFSLPRNIIYSNVLAFSWQRSTRSHGEDGILQKTLVSRSV
jgi:hypothetical protein